MIFKVNIKRLIISLIIPIAVGGISTLITSGDMDIYKKIKRPPLSPPSVVFPIVWAVLYILMGISLYLFWNTRKSNYDKKNGYIFFGISLALNLLWSPVFFSLKAFLPAVFILIALIVVTALYAVCFYDVNKAAGLLQIPYLIWLAIALYLNIGVYLLN